jgi:hypothetical protein
MADSSSGTHSPKLWGIDMPEHEETFDDRSRYDSSVELSPGAFFCMPEEGDARCESSVELSPTPFSCGQCATHKKNRTVDASLTPRRRKRVSFSGVRDVLDFPVADDCDGQASRELAILREVAVMEAPAQKKKKKRSVNFNAEAQTATFEVFTDMIPTRDMCDQVLLQLQEEEKQRETSEVTLSESSEGHRQVIEDARLAPVSCMHESGAARQSRAQVVKRVTFIEEPEVVSYGRTDENRDLSAQVEVPRDTHAILEAMVKDASRITVSPSAQPYLLSMRALIGENPPAVATSIQRRQGGHNLSHAHVDTNAQVLERLLSVAIAHRSSRVGSMSAPARTDMWSLVTAISNTLVLRHDRFVINHGY